jgi:hypothetical protein
MVTADLMVADAGSRFAKRYGRAGSGKTRGRPGQAPAE